jgi:hypothetical protein
MQIGQDSRDETMRTGHEIAQDCLSIWNEPDPTIRLARLHSRWLSYLAPRTRNAEISEANAAIDAIHRSFPTCRFRLAGTAIDRRNSLSFTWTFGSEAWKEMVECTTLVERDGDEFAFIDSGLETLVAKLVAAAGHP